MTLNDSLCLLVTLFLLSHLVLTQEQVPKACPKMIAPPYGSLLKCDTSNIGDTCYIRCPRGWDIIGDCFKTCRSSGSWSGSPVMCLDRSRSCPPVKTTNGGKIILPCVNNVGGTCSYSCPSDPKVVKSVTCLENTKWNDTVSCPPPITGCGPLIPPVSSYLLSSCRGEYGETCSVQCSVGYYLYGDPTLKCQENGLWSKNVKDANFPKCYPLRPGQTTKPPVTLKCPPVNPPFNGYAEGVCSNAQFGDTCKFGCSPGFKLAGIGAFTCLQTYEWDTPPSATCVFERSLCFNITAVPESYKSPDCRLLTIGSKCTITCGPGETPTTPIIITCLENGWDNPYPRCLGNRCRRISGNEVANAVAKGIGCQDGLVDDVCYFTCNPGFAMVGEGTLVCNQNGSWSPSKYPECIAIQCLPQILPLGVTVTPELCKSRIPVGTTCTYQCSDCSSSNGNQMTMATCQPNGSFDRQPPICRQVTCPRPNSPNALFGATCGTCNEECIMSCEPGFTLSSKVFPRCTSSGQWSSPFPFCTANPKPVVCPSVPQPANGYWIEGSCGGSVTTCNANCYDCFTLQGNPTYTCTSGNWNPPVTARCVPSQSSCPDIRTYIGPSGLLYQGCGTTCGTTCNYQCSSNSPVLQSKCTQNRFREQFAKQTLPQLDWNPRPFCPVIVTLPPTLPPPPPRACTIEAPVKGYWDGCNGGDDCNFCYRQVGESRPCVVRCYDGYDLYNANIPAQTVTFTCTANGQWSTNRDNVRCTPRTGTIPRQ